MYINDLNSAYLYEHERRADEMQTARHGQGLTFKRKNKQKELLALIVFTLFIIIWVVI